MKIRLKKPNRCVVDGSSNVPSLRDGIALHAIPFSDDDRPQVRKRRKKWVDFVKLKRAMWEPTKNSTICSKHFTPEDFERRFFLVPGQETGSFPKMKKDENVLTCGAMWLYGQSSSFITREQQESHAIYFLKL